MSHNAAPVAAPETAAELFAERGYDQVTIRDIAARADLSPAMVTKCGGSKREPFLQATKVTAPPLPDVPRSELGTVLVADLLARFRRGAVEPLARALTLRLTGLAAGVRVFATPATAAAQDAVIRRYGAAIQQLIDG